MITEKIEIEGQVSELHYREVSAQADVRLQGEIRNVSIHAWPLGHGELDPC
jgi:hypothetical protein